LNNNKLGDGRWERIKKERRDEGEEGGEWGSTKTKLKPTEKLNNNQEKDEDDDEAVFKKNKAKV